MHTYIYILIYLLFFDKMVTYILNVLLMSYNYYIMFQGSHICTVWSIVSCVGCKLMFLEDFLMT